MAGSSGRPGVSQGIFYFHSFCSFVNSLCSVIGPLLGGVSLLSQLIIKNLFNLYCRRSLQIICLGAGELRFDWICNA